MNEFLLIFPEIFLLLTLIFVVVAEVSYHGEQRRLVTATALMGLGAAFLQTVISYQYGAAQIFNHTISVDGLSLFFRLIFIGLAAFSVVAIGLGKEVPQSRHSEYVVMILAAVLAMCLCASAVDMVLAFLGLQCLNIISGFLAGYGKRSVASVEAGVKYMVLATVSGAFFLFALAILFAQTHSLNVYEMHRALLATAMEPQSMLVVFVLLLLSLGFQMGAFPVHFWVSDVVSGAPTPTAIFLSLGTRFAGFAVALRLLILVFAQPGVAAGQWQIVAGGDWPRILAVVSGATMIFGSLLAFRQNAAKRMVGYLIVAESGILLLGILILDQVGVAALLYNLVIELFALTGIFYVLSYLTEKLGSDDFQHLKGALGGAVAECICLTLFLLTLVGIPPLPGFIGKFALIGAAVRHGWFVLAGLAVFATGVSTVAVARLIYTLIGDLRYTLQPAAPVPPARIAYLASLAVPLFLTGVLAESVLDWVGRSLGFILW